MVETVWLCADGANVDGIPVSEEYAPLNDDVPAPMALRKSAAASAEIVLSALIRRNDKAPGFGSLSRPSPTVVAPSNAESMVSPAGSSLSSPPTRTSGRRVAIAQARVIGLWGSKVTSVAETAAPTSCTICPAVAGAVAVRLPAVAPR